MTKENQKNLPIAATLDGLSIGEKAFFPLVRFNSVKQSCSNRTLSHGLTFKTHINRANNIIEVTRIS